MPEKNKHNPSIIKLVQRTVYFVLVFVFVFSNILPAIISNIDFSKFENLNLKIDDSSVAMAAFNKQINYQGKLTNTSNMAVSDGSYNIRFRLCTDSSCSSVVWTERRCYSPDNGTTCDGTGTDQRVSVANGLFSVMLGSIQSLASLNFNQTLYLGVTIGGSGTTPSWDSEMSPRKTLGAVPAAFESDKLDGYDETAFAMLLGRSGGQTLIGGTGTTDDLVLQATSGVGASGSDIILKVGNNGATEAMRVLYNGQIVIGTSSPYTSQDKLTVESNPTGSTADANAIYGYAQGTFDTTSGDISNYSGFFEAAGTKSSGSNDLYNYGVYATAYGGDNNIAVYGFTDSGNAGAFYQTGALSASTASESVWIARNLTLGAYDATGAVLKVTDYTASTGNLFEVNKSASNKFVIKNTGYIGVGVSNPTSFELQVAGDIGPDANDTYTLGSTSLRWSDLYLGPGSLYIGTSATAQATINYNDTTQDVLQISTDSTANADISFFTDDLYLDKSAGYIGINKTDPGSALDVKGTLRLSGATSGYVGFAVQAAAGSTTYTWPAAPTNTYVLQTDGSGNLSWVAQTTSTNYWTLNGSDLYPNNTSYEVGIGNSAPGGMLDVTGTSNTAATMILTNNTATTIGAGGNTLGIIDLQSTSLTTGNFLNIEVNGLTTGKGINLTSNSTAGAGSNFSSLLNISRSGANSNASHSAYGIISSVTNTGTTSTNVAGYFSASGATNNYAGIFENGIVGIGTTAPNANVKLDVLNSSNAQIRVSYSTTRYADLKTDSAGNLYVSPYGTTGSNGYLSVGSNDGASGYGKLAVNGPKETAEGIGSQLVITDTTAYNSNPQSGIRLIGKYNTAGSFASFAGIQGAKENATDGNYAGYLSLFTRANGAGSLSERLRIDSSGVLIPSGTGGTLQIGTTSANGAISIASTRYTSGGISYQFTIQGTDAYNSGNSVSGIRFINQYNTGAYADMGSIELWKENTTAGQYGSYMSFVTRTNSQTPEERLRITSRGDLLPFNSSVGTGTMVIGDSSNNGRLQIMGTRLAVSNIDYQFTIQGLDAYDSGYAVSGIRFVNQYNTGAYADMGAIEVQKNNTTAGDYGGYMAFLTRNTGGNPTERVRISSTGYLGISNTSPGALLDIGTAGTTLGTMRLEGNTSGYVQIQPSAAAGSWTMTLPTGVPAANGYVLSSTTGGVTSWVAQAGAMWTDGGTYLYPTNRESLRVYDSGGTDYIDIAHDGTNANMTFANTGYLSVATNILPSANNTYDLGSDTVRWQDLYLNGGSLNIGETTDEATLVYDTTNNQLEINNSTSDIMVGIGTTAPSTLLQLGSAGTTAGTLSLAGGTSGLVTIDVAAAAGTWNFTLPTSAGINTYVLQTDGSGNTSWANPSGLGTNYWTDGGTYLYPTAYESLRVYDSGGTDYIDIAHDGTNANMTFSGTTALNVGTNLYVYGASSTEARIGTVGNSQTQLHIDRNEVAGSYNTDWYLYIPASSTDLRLYNGADRITFQADGDVGIGVSPSNFKLEVAGNFGPSANNTYDLGSDTVRWQDLYLNNGSLHIGETTDESTLVYDTTNNQLEINNSTSDIKVGIGNTNPSEMLEVSGGIKLGNSSGTNAGTLRYTGSDIEGYVSGAWTSLTAGGTGGNIKQLVREFTAATGESISAGDVVSFVNGELMKGTNRLGTESALSPASAATNVSAAALDSTHFVLAYVDTGNSSYGTAVVGSVSGTTITWGTESVFNSATTAATSVTALSSSQFVVAYQDSGNSSYGTARIGNVSDTSISSWGSESVFNSALTTATAITALSSSKIVVAYYDSAAGQGQDRAATISGSTFTWGGSEYVYNAGTTTYSSITALTDAWFAITFSDGTNSSYGTAIIGSVPATAITHGSKYVFNGASSTYTSVAKLSADKFIVGYRDSSTDNYQGTATIGNVNGYYINYGGKYVYNGNTDYVSVSTLSSNKAIISYRDRDNSDYGTMVVADISGDTISYSNEVVFASAVTNYISSAYFGSNKYVIGYQDNGNSNYVTAIIGDVYDELGVAKAAISGGSSGLVVLTGVSDGHSGLTSGSYYYANADGSLTTTANANLVGLAISSSEIFLQNAAVAGGGGGDSGDTYWNRNSTTGYVYPRTLGDDLRVYDSTGNDYIEISHNGTNAVLSFAGTTGLIPGADDTYSLGIATARWSDLYLGAGSLHIGTNATDESIVSYDTTNNTLEFMPYANSTSAFEFQNASGAPIVSIDSTNARVGINATPNEALTVAGYVSLQEQSANPSSTSSYGKLYAIAGDGGLDDDVKLLLHANGTDASTTFTDSSFSAKTVTASGDAQLDTAQKKFGTASGLFNGGDYISTADSDDWAFGSGDFTIDFWVRFNALPSSGNDQMFLGQDDNWKLYLYNNSGTYEYRFTATNISDVFKASPGLATGTWYHVALVRTGNDFKIFQGGTQCGTTVTDSDSMPDSSSALQFGRIAGTGVGDFNGWVDELRISKGIARWSTNFTPQATEYGMTSGLYYNGTQLGAGDSLWSANGTSAYYNTGNVGIGTTAPTSVLQTAASGAQTASYIGNLLTNTATSSTASITKTGLSVESTGSWAGTSAVNRGLYVNAAGGTVNYSAIFEGGNVGIGTTTPGQTLTVDGTLGILEGGASPTYHTIMQGGDQSANITYTLPVNDGTEGQVLRSDGTGILSWTDPSAAGGPSSSFSVSKNADQTGITNGSLVALTWQTENFDTNGDFYPAGSPDPVTGCSSCFRPSIAGKYIITANADMNIPAEGYGLNLHIIKNGTTTLASGNTFAQGNNPAMTQAASVTAVVDLNGTTDYIKISVYHNYSTSSRTVYNNSYTNFSGSSLAGGGTSGVVPAFSVNKNGTNQTGIASATLTKVTWSTEDFDTNNNFDTGTSRFTPTVSGKYLLTASLDYDSVADGEYSTVGIYKNGSLVKLGTAYPGGATDDQDPTISVIVEADGDDYFEIYAYHTDPASKTIEGSTYSTYFTGSRIDGGSGWWVKGASGLYYNSTNVGIGETAPASLLEISDTDANPTLTITNKSDTAYDPQIQFRVGATPSTAFTMGVDDSDSNKFKVSVGSSLGTSDALIIDSSGNVGINTSPSYKLHVVGKGYFSNTGNSTGGVVGGTSMGVYGRYGGTFSEPSPSQNSGVFGYGSTGNSIGIMGESAGGHGLYGLADSGSSNAGVYGYGQSGGYDFYAAGPGTDYGTSSSIRWKNNITRIDDALQKVLNMRGVYYDWDTDHGGQHDMGMIAEEVGQYVPEIVSWDPDNPGYATGMDYGHLTPILVEAVKEQNTLVVGLQDSVDAINTDLTIKQTAIDQIGSLDSTSGTIADTLKTHEENISYLNDMMLKFMGEITVTEGNVYVNKLTVTTAAEIQGKLAVKGQVAFNKDTVGQAKILACKDADKTKCPTSVHVTFEQEYEYQPIITITNVGKHKIQYQYVDKVTTKGFDIVIDPTQDEDVLFDWHAFGSDQGKIFVSDGTTADIEIIKSDSSTDTSSVTFPTF